MSSSADSKRFSDSDIDMWEALLKQLAIVLTSLGIELEKKYPTPKPAPLPVDPPKPMPIKYLWSTPAEARHSVRVLCDEMGLSLVPTVKVDGKLYTPKDVICACIMQESGFMNLRADGTPMINNNKNKLGRITSTDWGIVQINDTKGWHIGPGLPFKDIADVVENPEKAVRYMITMFKAGKIRLWSSYATGAFKKYLPK